MYIIDFYGPHIYLKNCPHSWQPGTGATLRDKYRSVAYFGQIPKPSQKANKWMKVMQSCVSFQLQKILLIYLYFDMRWEPNSIVPACESTTNVCKDC